MPMSAAAADFRRTNELVVVSLSRVRDDGNIGRDEERVVAETYAVARTPAIGSTR